MFFQAEDGIREAALVTGVQTCALPISSPDERAGRRTLAVLDSKRSEVFMQLFDADLAPLGDPREIALAALATAVSPGPLLLTGDAAEPALAALDRKSVV